MTHGKRLMSRLLAATLGAAALPALAASAGSGDSAAAPVTPPVTPAAAPPATRLPLVLSATIPLPDITGGDFDHFAVDAKRGLLYVSAEIYGSIEVFSLRSGKHLRSVTNVAKHPHKIELLDDGRTLLVADAGDAACLVVSTDTWRVRKRLPMVPQPDTGVLDAAHGLFYLGNGGVRSHADHAYVSVLSTRAVVPVGRIDVPGGTLKAMAIDPAAHRLFVNLRDRNAVAVIDLRTRRVLTTWPVPGPSVNSAMGLDAAGGRLFIGSRNPGKLFVLNSRDGTVRSVRDIVDVSDDMTYDAAHQRLYVSGAGGVDVVDTRAGDGYKLLQHVDTFGGKTSVYVPALRKFFVVHTKGPQAPQAALQVFDVQ
ncbi:MAG: YncE family protein [Janthinobacterium lividum]